MSAAMSIANWAKLIYFEGELENYVDTEDEVCLVNNRSSFSDAVDDLPVDSSM